MSKSPFRREPLGNQFEPDGAGYLYRRYPDGPPVHVSAAERDAYVEDLRQWTGWTLVTIFTLLLAGAVAVAFLDNYLGPESAMRTLGPVAFLVLVSGWISYRVIRAPAPADARPPEPGALRFSEERRHMPIAGYSYQQLALAASAAWISVWTLSRLVGGPNGWGWLWLVAAVAMLSPFAIVALRKRREERG